MGKTQRDTSTSTGSASTELAAPTGILAEQGLGNAQTQDGLDLGASPGERAELIHTAFHGSWWGEDEEAALRQLGGDPGALRSAYAGAYGKDLEQEFRDHCSAGQANQAIRFLWPAMPLSARLNTHLSGGIFGDSANEEGLLDVIQSATVAQQIAAGRDAHTISLLASHLDADQLLAARRLLQPDQLSAAVLERIKAANGWVNDDESAVFDVLLELPPAERRALWENNPDAFSFLGGTDRARVQSICTGTEAQALQERMAEATDGMGTDDAGVSGLIAHAAGLRDEQAQLRAALEQPDLSEDQQRQISSRLAEIGDLDGLLEVQRNADGEIAGGSFLGMMRGDVSEGEYRQFSAQLGVAGFEQAKQEILDAVGWISDDENAVYEAFQRIQDTTLRQQLWDDAQVQAALGSLSSSEQDTAASFRDGDSQSIAMTRLEEAWSHWDVDEARVFALISEMSGPDREHLRYSTLYQSMMLGIGSPENIALREVTETGRVPTGSGINAALGGAWDGTNTDLLGQVLTGMGDGERWKYRLGYWLNRSGRAPQDEEQEQALETFNTLESRLQSELGTDDLETALDQLVGVPTPQELQTEAGRIIAAGILTQRVDDKQSHWDGVGQVFTESDETADGMEVQLDASYMQAMEDGVMSAEELAVLASLDSRFAERYQQSLAAIDRIRNIAATVAAVAAGIVVTALTAGAAGPVVAGLLSSYGAGALAGGIAGAVVRVGVSEAMGGDHFDSISGEGATEAAVGFTDGAMAVLANGLATRATGWVGLKGAQLSGAMALGSIEAAGGALQTSGRAFAAGAVRGGIDGLLSGMVGELVLTAADQATWRQSVWDVVISFGEAALRGGTIGAATGGLVGGGIDALGAYVSRSRIESLVQDLESIGIPRQQLDSMPLDEVRALAQLDAALAAGDVDRARQLFGEMPSVDDAKLRLLQAKLVETHFGADRVSAMGLEGVAGAADLLNPGFRATADDMVGFANVIESPQFAHFFTDELGPGGMDEWYAALVTKLGADHPAVSTLTPEELLGVYGYTTNAFEDMNSALRTLDPDELDTIMPFLKSATSGLNAMPSVQQTLTRRMKDGAVRHIDHLLVEGTVFSDNAFSSSSIYDDLTQFGNRYIVDIRGKTGAFVEDISRYGGEGEVLFAPGARFRVIRRWQDGSTTRVILQELN